MPRHEVTTIFVGELITIRDVCCREPLGGCGAEEYASAHQVVFTRSGVFLKHSPTSRNREYLADPLRALVFNKDEPFRVSHPSEGGDECTMFAFPPEVAREVVDAVDPRAQDGPILFRVTHAPVDTAATRHYRALRDLARMSAQAIRVEEEGLVLLADVLRAGLVTFSAPAAVSREATKRLRRELVERTREALACAPSERWTLKRLARHVHSSPFHLTRVFRQHTGMPAHRFLLQLRLLLALERLEEGERNLTSLALSFGFSSHSHFTNAFTETFGISPSAYRGRQHLTVSRAAERVRQFVS
jgi:AraC family transcriptional regulator